MEPFAYRENLEAILEFSKGRHLLSIGEVGLFCGIRDYKSLKQRFPFQNSKISAATLAKCLSGGKREENPHDKKR